MVLKQLSIHIHTQKMNLDTDLILFTKMNSKWIIDLNVKHKAIKLLEDNIEENLDDFWFDNDLLHTTPKA